MLISHLTNNVPVGKGLSLFMVKVIEFTVGNKELFVIVAIHKSSIYSYIHIFANKKFLFL